MKTEAIGRFLLSPVGVGSPLSYELIGEHIVGKFFGLVPIIRIHLETVYYFRLATRREANPFYLLLNWPNFMLTSRKSTCPVYIIQTRKGQRLFMKLAGSEHYRLRQAIARHSERKNHKLAA